MSGATRIPAWLYHVERLYGEKVPQCWNCGSEDVYENHARACWHCNGCEYDISDRLMVWVPKDEQVRRPEEMAGARTPKYPARTRA